MSGAPTPLLTALLIDGELVQGQGFAEPIINPATGEVLPKLLKPAPSRSNQPSSQRTVHLPAGRGPRRNNVRTFFWASPMPSKNKPITWPAWNPELRKPLHLARQDDLSATVDVFRFFAGAVRCQTGQLSGEYLPGYTSMVRRDPIGRGRLHCTVELPVDDGRLEDRPALAAGNTLVFKPSEHTPLSILALAPC